MTAKEAQQIIEEVHESSYGRATYECTHAITKDNETRLLLDYYGSKLRGSCSLVYGMEAVLPIEMGVHSLRTILESEKSPK